MVKDFKFPDVGEGITEGEVVKWLVEEGDIVKEDQPLLEVETDKAIVEIPSPWSGKVLKIHAGSGEIVKVGQPLVSIGGEGEEAPPEPRRREAYGIVGELEVAEEEEEVEANEEKEKVKPPRVLATPKVRKLAKELGLDLSKLKGTGKGGRITEEDLRKAKEEEKPEKKPAVRVTRKYDLYGYIERVPLRGIRRATAKKMVEALRIPHVTHMDEADVTELVEVRRKVKAQVAHLGVKVTYLPFIIKAVIEGLKAHPYLNAVISEDGEEVTLKKYYNIGIAVDIEDGLIVPVIKGADQKSIADLAKEIARLAKSAKERKLDLGDLKGGTFTITNIGVIGGTHATPIIHAPEVAILGVGKIVERPRIVDGKVVPKQILPLSLSFDHRVIDGAEAARFLNEVIMHLEKPEILLVEI
jgi:pyruvate dehydrogenase E2 component (dihydrolipoamide acetyltransferase)